MTARMPEGHPNARPDRADSSGRLDQGPKPAQSTSDPAESRQVAVIRNRGFAEHLENDHGTIAEVGWLALREQIELHDRLHAGEQICLAGSDWNVNKHDHPESADA